MALPFAVWCHRYARKGEHRCRERERRHGTIDVKQNRVRLVIKPCELLENDYSKNIFRYVFTLPERKGFRELWRITAMRSS